MKVTYGGGGTQYGPGVRIELRADEVAAAIDLWIYSQGVVVQGPRTISYDGELLNDSTTVYVDPSGRVIDNGNEMSGSGP